MTTWEPPNSISPSRMATWLQCELKFRVETMQKLPSGTNAAAVAGTTMHSALEHLMNLPGEERTPIRLAAEVEQALVEIRDDPDYQSLTPEQLKGFDEKCRTVAPLAFDLVDVPGMNVEATELKLEVDLDGWILRGIIDLLEDRPGLGRLVLDWKSGKAPKPRYEAKALLGLEFYAVMVTRHFGQMPAGVGLLYIAERKSIKRLVNREMVDGMERRILQVRSEIVSACESGEFETKVGPLCDWCAVRPFCPAFGNSPDDIPTPADLHS